MVQADFDNLITKSLTYNLCFLFCIKEKQYKFSLTKEKKPQTYLTLFKENFLIYSK